MVTGTKSEIFEQILGGGGAWAGRPTLKNVTSTLRVVWTVREKNVISNNDHALTIKNMQKRQRQEFFLIYFWD